MSKEASYTYELRRFVEDANAGIEDYVVRTADGAAVGTVAGLLRHGDDLLLAVEAAATAPIAHERRAVPWERVESIDHDALAVWLSLSEPQFRQADELPPDAQREGAEAEARRVTELPPELTPRPETAPAGPVDRAAVPLLPALVGAVAFGVLVVVAAATALQTPWLYLGFVVPAVIAAAAIGFVYRAWRKPYEARGAKKP